MDIGYKLIGLNMPWKAGGFNGYYATIQKGNDDSDWFHSGFDEKLIPFQNQKRFFDLFKNSEENLWKDKNHIAVINSETKKIVELKLDFNN